MTIITEEECKKCGLCCWFDLNAIWGETPEGIREDGFCIHRFENGCKIYEKRFMACRSLSRGGPACISIRNRLYKLLK